MRGTRTGAELPEWSVPPVVMPNEDADVVDAGYHLHVVCSAIAPPKGTYNDTRQAFLESNPHTPILIPIAHEKPPKAV